MIFVKTPSGQEALKDRRGGLTSRQRSAFILFDGKRTLAQVLAATAPMGITENDVQSMIEQGLLVSAAGAQAGANGANGASAGAGETAAPGSDRAPTERYQAAYPIATELTAGLGLLGFRLNLAVEGAAGYDDLVALAPKIREAVGDAKYARLEQALFA